MVCSVTQRCFAKYAWWVLARINLMAHTSDLITLQVRYDLRGHGRSGMPEDPQAYTSVLFAHDYATVVREFGIQKPFIAVW